MQERAAITREKDKARDCSHCHVTQQSRFGVGQLWDGITALPFFSCRTLKAWFEVSHLQFHFIKQRLAIFFQGQVVNILCFVGCMVSVQ